jgi:hypothetical protein
MKQKISIFIGSVLLLLTSTTFAKGISFGQTTDTKNIPLEYKQIKRYTIQLISTKTLQQAQQSVAKLPLKYKQQTHFYKVGSYVAARYSYALTTKKLKPYLQELQKYGFKDAYILQTTKWHMLHNILDNNKTLSTQVEKKSTPYKLSKYKYSKILLQADKAYMQGDETKALLYYELLYNTQHASQQVKINLCYLYGKQGAWYEAKELIKKQNTQVVFFMLMHMVPTKAIKQTLLTIFQKIFYLIKQGNSL